MDIFLSKSRYRWKCILRPILVCLLHTHYGRPCWKGDKDLDTFGKRKTSPLKQFIGDQPTNWPSFSSLVFAGEWTKLIKRLKHLQCHIPCMAVHTQICGGGEDQNFSVLPVHLLFPESKTILQGSVQSHKGVSWVICHVHAVIFVMAVDISQVYSVSGKAKCRAQAVHRARDPGLALTETSTASTARGAVTECSFPSVLCLGRDQSFLLIWTLFISSSLLHVMIFHSHLCVNWSENNDQWTIIISDIILFKDVPRLLGPEYSQHEKKNLAWGLCSCRDHFANWKC